MQTSGGSVGEKRPDGQFCSLFIALFKCALIEFAGTQRIEFPARQSGDSPIEFPSSDDLFRGYLQKVRCEGPLRPLWPSF